MLAKNTKSLANRVNSGVDGRIMFQNETSELVLLTLKPGEIIPEHNNPFDVLFIGIQGWVLIESNGQKEEISPGDTLFIGREHSRKLHNPSGDPVMTMVLKLL